MAVITKRPRVEAIQIEQCKTNPRVGLVNFERWTDEHGDQYQKCWFDDGTIEVWREWDDPREMRLIEYTDEQGRTREFWAED